MRARWAVVTVMTAGLGGGCQGGDASEGAPPAVARPHEHPTMSAMGARAHAAVRALAKTKPVVWISGGDDEIGDDDESGGPGALDDALPGGSQAELSIAVDDTGQHIVIGFNDFRGFSLAPISVSGFMYSDDGGQTFHDGGQLPAGPAGATLPEVFGDPDVKYLGDCNFVYSSIVVAPFGGTSSVQTMGVHRSRDCGHTWEGPFVVTSASNPNGIVVGAAPFDAADKEFIDVDRATGRVLMSWTNFSARAEMSTTYSDDVLAATGPTWSARVIVGDRDIDGQGSIPRFDASGNAYVAWATFFDDGNRGISVARSADGGASFGAPVDLVADGFFPIDQILGNDRVHSFPSMVVDKSHTGRRGTVYVAYAQNDAGDGADVVVQRSVDHGASFGAPVFVTSRPGADRSQWFPALANNDRLGRVLVSYYDQGVADDGDLTQTSYTFSDGGGVWAQPRRLSPRTFHAGWGNDTSQPNLGDYQQGVVGRAGNLLDAYAITHSVGFRDGEPTTTGMTVPEPIVTSKTLLDQLPVTPLDLRGVTATEGAVSNHNGFLDAGEHASIAFSVRNYVTNPMSARSTGPALGLVQSITPGVHVLSPLVLFPSVAPGATAAGTLPVLVRLDPTFVTGQDVTITLLVFSAIGLPVTLEGTFRTGTPAETVLVSEGFDGAAPGTLPPGWNAVHGAGANVVRWTTSSTFCGTTSNAAFHTNAADGASPTNNARWERLIGPTFTVPADADYVTVDLDVCTDTEDDPAFNLQAYDGLFLRVFDATPGDLARSVLVEAFQQDFTTGAAAGYAKHLPRSNNPAYFPDMSVWAGDSHGIQHVRLRLAGMAGATAQLRFEFTQDEIATCADVRPGHTCGVLVDNVVVKSVKAH